MVKRLVGLICYERFPGRVGGDFSPVALRNGRRVDAWLCSVCVDQMQAGKLGDISPGVNYWE